MKFCQYFNISPVEYARIPNKKIQLWLQMLEVEANVGDWKSKRQIGLDKLNKLKK